VCALVLVPLSVGAAPTSLSLQYGDNFEDQKQYFANMEFSASDLGYVDLGLGSSDYQVTPNVTLTTDYYSIGYSSPRDQSFVVGLNYDYWERGSLSSDSYTADLYLYKGDWEIGLHPEQHYITLNLAKRRAREFTNSGIGFSLAYFAGESLYIYADHYSYNYDAPPLPNLYGLPLRLQIGLRLLTDRISSEFDDKRSTFGINYQYEFVSFGIEKQWITSAITSDKYDITSISASLMLGGDWQADVNASHANDGGSDFYTFGLTYNW
jgi:hypothetical protein